MAYATGSAVDEAALMTAVINFAVANAGMTLSVSRTETISAAVHEVRGLSKGGHWWWFRYRAGVIAGVPTNGTGATWATIATRPVNDSQLFPLAAPFTSYHLFTEGTFIWVAVEQASGAWQHFCFGDITKVGSWTGGQYMGMTYIYWSFNDPSHVGNNTALNVGNMGSFYSGAGLVWYPESNWNGPLNPGASYLYAPFNSKNFASCQVTPADATYNKMGAFLISEPSAGNNLNLLQSSRLNNFNGRTSGVRCEAYIRDPASDLYLRLGYFPNVRFISILNYNPGDLINTDWMVFPLSKKATTGGLYQQYMATGDLGIAVRKV